MTSPKAIRDESGTALIEFALVLPLLLVLVLGIADFGRAFNCWLDSTNVANVGARYAAVNKQPPVGLTLQQYIEQRASTDALRDGNAHQTAVDVHICVETLTVGALVKVTTTSRFTWLGYLVGRVEGSG